MTISREMIENRRKFLRGITDPDDWVDALCDAALLSLSETRDSPKGEWCEHTRQFDCTTLGDCNENGCQRDRNFLSDKQETFGPDRCRMCGEQQHDGQCAKRSASDKQETPRTDANLRGWDIPGPFAEFARQLERELAEATDRLAGYERHVAVLEGIQETHEEEALSARGEKAATDFVPQPHRHQGPVAGCAECERESQSLHLCPACGFPHDPNERG